MTNANINLNTIYAAMPEGTWNLWTENCIRLANITGKGYEDIRDYLVGRCAASTRFTAWYVLATDEQVANYLREQLTWS